MLGAGVCFWCYFSAGFRNLILVQYWAMPYVLGLSMVGSIFGGKWLTKKLAKNLIFLEE